jgi:hypothetical protein
LLQKAICKEGELTNVMSDFVNKLKAIGGYKKAFTETALRGKSKTADCLIIGVTPTGRFIYMILRDFYSNGSILIKTDSLPLYEFKEDSEELEEYLSIAKRWKKLNSDLKKLEKKGLINNG